VARQRERSEVERNRRGAGALADHDVDTEILHRQVQHLFCAASHPVDLVDEQHLARHQRRQHRSEIARVLDGRTARHPERPAGLVGHDHRQRGLAEPGRACQQDVIRGAFLHLRSGEKQLQLSAHLLLSHELREGARS
jgi:hypothetical protein